MTGLHVLCKRGFVVHSVIKRLSVCSTLTSWMVRKPQFRSDMTLRCQQHCNTQDTCFWCIARAPRCSVSFCHLLILIFIQRTYYTHKKLVTPSRAVLRSEACNALGDFDGVIHNVYIQNTSVLLVHIHAQVMWIRELWSRAGKVDQDQG